ncbi:hypothetical protein KM043_013783 [Ampulex compressa]|nr:hypothetical protein KM043_013783 [Ampulex compressa]
MNNKYKMLKTFTFGKRTCHELNRFTVLKRLFLSEAYKCEEAWNQRLNSPLLQKIKPGNMYLDLKHKFSVVGKVYSGNYLYVRLYATCSDKNEDFSSAAKVAALLMLQEDAEHPITNALSIYSCHKYLERPDDWKKPVPPEDTEEEIKVRVKYLRNPFFDDHFDLTDPRDLVGKTLSFQGKQIKNALGRTCQLRGLILYKKYDEVKNLVQNWLETIKDDIVYEEVFNLIDQDNTNISEDGSIKELEGLQDNLKTLKAGPLCKQGLEEAIKSLINAAINEQAEKDISQQCQRYIEWENSRMSLLNQQRKEMEKEKKMAELEEMQRELAERERLLTFFEREEQIEMEIAYKQKQEQNEKKRIERIPKSAKKLRKLIEEEVYTPPEIRKK